MTTTETVKGLTFEKFMWEVRDAVGFITLGQLSVHDLADSDFYSSWENGKSPMATAVKVLRENGWK